MVIFLKIMIFLVAGMVLMRGYYLWSLRGKKSKYTFRNQDGDLTILLIILFIINRSSLQRYSLSYEPILRYLYPILIALLIGYCFLQLTQIIMIADTKLITPQGIIERENIKEYKIKKSLYRYKMIVYYMKKGKEAHLTFFVSKKDKKMITHLVELENINIV